MSQGFGTPHGISNQDKILCTWKYMNKMAPPRHSFDFLDFTYAV